MGLRLALGPVTAADAKCGSPGGDLGCEDPRQIWMPEREEWVIAYTAYSPRGPLASVALTRDLHEVRRLRPVTTPEDNDAAIVAGRALASAARQNRRSQRASIHGARDRSVLHLEVGDVRRLATTEAGARMRERGRHLSWFPIPAASDMRRDRPARSPACGRAGSA